MASTYCDIAVERLLETLEAVMNQGIVYWTDPPASMKDSLDQFRSRLGPAINPVGFVKRALDGPAPRERVWLIF